MPVCNYSLRPHSAVFWEKYMNTNRYLNKDDVQISHLVHQVNFISKPVCDLSSEGTERFSTLGNLQNKVNKIVLIGGSLESP